MPARLRAQKSIEKKVTKKKKAPKKETKKKKAKKDPNKPKGVKSAFFFYKMLQCSQGMNGIIFMAHPHWARPSKPACPTAQRGGPLCRP